MNTNNSSKIDVDFVLKDKDWCSKRVATTDYISGGGGDREAADLLLHDTEKYKHKYILTSSSLFQNGKNGRMEPI